MPDSYLNIGISALASSQASINTTSHNIANANTEGYSRQRAELSARIPQFFGGNFFGSGVEVNNVRRIFNGTVALEIQDHTSDVSEKDIFLEQASRLDSLMADTNTGIHRSLQNYFSAVQAVANEPSSITARQVLLSQSDILVKRFNTLYDQLETQRESINLSFKNIAQQVTTLSSNLAELNTQITAAFGGNQGAPNDLLDERERVLVQLSELVDISTIETSGGNVNVFIGTGQALVVGAVANQIVAQPDTDDPQNMDILLQTGSTSTSIVGSLSGGEIGGYLRIRNEVLTPAYNTLGRVALGISETMNNQHQLGMDLNNNLGGLFFSDINSTSASASRAVSDTGNTGSLSLSVDIDDVSVLNNSNYSLSFNAGNYTLTNETTSTVISTFAAPGALPATVTFASEGFSINLLSGTVANGDSFKILPTRLGARDITLAISDPALIAAALPVSGQSSVSNIGTGKIDTISVTDTTTPQLSNIANDLDPPLIIEFVSGTTFNVRNANTNALITGPVAGFVANQQNNLLGLAGLSYGYEVTMSGTPQAGDTFNIQYNQGGTGDNRNILAMADLQLTNTLDNGSSNYQEAFSRLVSDVGSKTQEARINLTASQSLLTQATERQKSISGVNLDEEAANLIKFEQAYQAAAQVVQVARTLFQSVLDITR